MQEFNYSLEDQSFRGKYILPDDTPSDNMPAVLIFHDWSGCNQMSVDYAQAIAKLGFIGIAVDLYGDEKTANNIEEKTTLMQPLLDDRARLLSISQAAIDAAKTLKSVDENSIVIIGFCFGGLCVLDVARSGVELKGAVSFHGNLVSSEAVPAANIKTPIMVLHGDLDPLAPFSQAISLREELDAAAADWQMTIYSHTYHGFMNPNANDKARGILYNASVAKKAWGALTLFLSDAFTGHRD